MNEVTRSQAISIAKLLDVDKGTVWEIIKGMHNCSSFELAMAVHRAFAHGLSRAVATPPVYD